MMDPIIQKLATTITLNPRLNREHISETSVNNNGIEPPTLFNQHQTIFHQYHRICDLIPLKIRANDNIGKSRANGVTIPNIDDKNKVMIKHFLRPYRSPKNPQKLPPIIIPASKKDGFNQ